MNGLIDLRDEWYKHLSNPVAQLKCKMFIEKIHQTIK